MRKGLMFAVALALTAVCGAAANADEYKFTYSGGGSAASGVFTTNASGAVVSGSGVFQIPSLAPIDASLVPGAGTDNAFAWDNQFPLTDGGLLFEDATLNYEINLFLATGATSGVGTVTDASLHIVSPADSTNYTRFDNGTLTIAAVPEPATWAMLMLGAAVAGLALRRRRDGVALAA